MSENMKKWLAGVLATILSGVAIFYLTQGMQKPTPPPTPTPTPRPPDPPPMNPQPQRPQAVPMTSQFTMIGLRKLSGGDCEMDTDPQDTVKVNFSSELKYTATEVTLSVSYDAKEYGGNGTKVGDTKRQVLFRAPDNKRISRVDHRGSSIVSIKDYGAQGRNHGFRDFGNRMRNTYWNFIEYKVDDRGGNDCAVAGVRGEIGYTVHLLTQ